MLSRYCLVIALCLPLQVFAQTVGKITFIEGKLRVIRGVAVLPGVQGAAVDMADIIETMKPGFALVEFSDGTVIALGDATRLMLSPAGKAGTPEILLLDGWLKMQSRVADGAGNSIIAPLQAVSVRTTSLIIHGAKTGGEVFVESGTASVGITDKQGRPSGMTAAKAGQFLTRTPDKAPGSQTRPADAFVAAMPGAFRDALPARLERFKDRKIEMTASGPVSYEDVADWLSAASGWRTGFVKRFEPRISDVSFRKSLDANLKRHPEWDKILHPPKPVN
jgi:hypothetical protein